MKTNVPQDSALHRTKSHTILIAFSICLLIFATACAQEQEAPAVERPASQRRAARQQNDENNNAIEPGPQDAQAPPQTAENETLIDAAPETQQPRPCEYLRDFSFDGSIVFAAHTNGLDDGLLDIIITMENYGICFYEIIEPNSVVLLQINVQWAERGGTNTDLIARTIEAILAHPLGFTGEIIVADNGQAQFGSDRRGGNLNWANPNSACRQQSTLDVVTSFRQRGYHVSAVLWDEFTTVRVGRFSDGDYTDGFIVEDYIFPTGLEVSYPKFTTQFGTHVSFSEGIWDSASGTYDSERLRVITMPVLKSHGLFQQTGVVKGYMGVVSDRLTNMRSHHSVGTGGMGTIMVQTRMPVLNIMDMIWVGPDRGPASSYASAVEVNMIAVSLDPVALDVWATRHVLIPLAEQIPGGRAAAMNPAGTEPGTFGHWLRLSLNEMTAAGYNFTMDESEILLVMAN